jgi:hypothetical protein
MKTEEQLIQEARIEAEKVYPHVESESDLNQRLAYLKREAFEAGYIANAKKQMSEMLKFAWWVDNNYISYTEGRYIDGKNPENPTLTEEEVYNIFKQLKQE